MSLVVIYYVVLVGVLVPVHCVRSYFRLKAGMPYPPKPRIYLQTLAFLGVFLFLAYCAWRPFWSSLFPPLVFRARDLALGTAALIVFVAGMYPLWKRSAIRRREKVYQRVPQSHAELGWWAAASLAAGIIEEIVYRGVLFGILFYWLGNWWIAALLCSLSFALGHAIQGWKSTAIIFVMAMMFHGMVRATGSLYVAMAVHATYDFIAGVVFASLYQRTAGVAVPA